MNLRNVVDAAIVDTGDIRRERTADPDVEFGAVFHTVTFVNDDFALFPDSLVPADDRVWVKLAKVENGAKIHVPVSPLHDVCEAGRVSQKLVVTRRSKHLAELAGEVASHVRQNVQGLVGALKVKKVWRKSF